MRATSFFAAVVLGAGALVLSPDPTTGGAGVREAHATVALLMSTEELVAVSKHVVVGEPVERFSKWEKVGGSNRIVTYTRLVVSEGIVAAPESESVWVRTLGGKVDKIGQSVAGEAEFKIGEPAVVFLASLPSEGESETLVVVGMAQGHYPIETKDGERVLRSSPDTGHLVRKKGESRRSAREDLVGAKLDVARTKILEAAKAQKK
jgi:hypothetical protein